MTIAQHIRRPRHLATRAALGIAAVAALGSAAGLGAASASAATAPRGGEHEVASVVRAEHAGTRLDLRSPDVRDLSSTDHSRAIRSSLDRSTSDRSSSAAVGDLHVSVDQHGTDR